jgi:hypothetical protein
VPLKLQNGPVGGRYCGVEAGLGRRSGADDRGIVWLLHPAGYDDDCFSAATDLLDLLDL